MPPLEPHAAPRRPLLVPALLSALAAACLAGCATSRGFTAEVELQGPIGGTCMMGAFDSEPDVSDLVQTEENAISFRISLPGVERKHWPAYSLVEEQNLDGKPVLSLSTDYETGLFEPPALAQQQRARELAVHITEECTGHRPTLGETIACGAGESDDLCARGR